MQTRIDAVVAAAREFADKLLVELPADSADRQAALTHCRMAFERGVVAIMTEPQLSAGPPPEIEP
jgi:hypothetical protein